MNKLIYLMGVMLFSLSLKVHASELTYSCKAKGGTSQSVLKISSQNSIVWIDATHFTSTAGVLVGIDLAPASSRKGELQYNLIGGFSESADKRQILSVPNVLAFEPFLLKPTIFIDNDDHSEDEVIFTCFKI